MSSGYLGLTMLALIVVAIMMGFPTAFTLMGLGMLFGFVAYFDPGQAISANHVFDLMVQRTYGAMTNDTLLSIPLFVLMGYVIERAALVDKMFHAVQLAFRRLPASLAIATLLVCTFWGIASGIVGAVVVLMGVIAMRPMLKAGYDVRLASGVITAGGTLGILIPPSVMIIVYAAVAGQSVVKLYAAAMLPGFFLAALYFAYIVGWAMINPKIAPKLPPEEITAKIPDWLQQVERRFGHHALLALLRASLSPGKLAALRADGGPSWFQAVRSLGVALLPLALAVLTFWSAWWFVTIKNAPATDAVPSISAPKSESSEPGASTPEPASQGLAEPPGAAEPPDADAEEKPQELGGSGGVSDTESAPLQELGRSDAAGSGSSDADASSSGLQELSEPGAESAEVRTEPIPDSFYWFFWGSLAFTVLLLLYYYAHFGSEQFEVLRLLLESVVPLAILSTVVLVVILFGITTATESAAVGAFGAFLLAWQSGQLTWQRTKEAVFLTAKTTAMVCWLFVGSALFSAVFALHGGQQLIEHWILGLNLSPLQFLLLAQALIFFLGWPLEWTEIIVIFVPIFLPLLAHFQIDPVLFATLVAVNLQAAFLSPPVAMSAFYLKGVSPPHVTLNQIFAGMMPYMFIVILCMVLMYMFPAMTLWLPDYLYGK